MIAKFFEDLDIIYKMFNTQRTVYTGAYIIHMYTISESERETFGYMSHFTYMPVQKIYSCYAMEHQKLRPKKCDTKLSDIQKLWKLLPNDAVRCVYYIIHRAIRVYLMSHFSSSLCFCALFHFYFFLSFFLSHPSILCMPAVGHIFSACVVHIFFTYS